MNYFLGRWTSNRILIAFSGVAVNNLLGDREPVDTKCKSVGPLAVPSTYKTNVLDKKENTDQNTGQHKDCDESNTTIERNASIAVDRLRWVRRNPRRE